MFLPAILQVQIAQNEDDLKLMLGIVNRDESALAAIYDRYSSLVYTMALKILKATDEAEDLVQEVFMVVWNKAGMFVETKGSVYTWIITIARRKAIDRLRSNRNAARSSRIDDDIARDLPDAAYASNPLHVTISSEYESLMRSGLGLLAHEQRSIIELSYYEGYTQEQISKRLGIPLGTIKTRMRQGLMKLRNHLRERLE